ncbi:hypothetical protein R5R35_002826 [Gryllus longicercus]|uniref:Uncharacterized protein n=1 Tax=Gryllus longicercus TaxID=2509291 RepID=A0AAN9W2C3_9ORTH
MDEIMDCEDCNSPPTFVQNVRERVATIVKLLIEKVLGEQADGSSPLNEDCRAPCCPCGRPITKEDILEQLIQLTRLCEASNVQQESTCISRDKPSLKRKRPHESVSDHDISFQQTSKDRRQGLSVFSEDGQKKGTQVSITVSNYDCSSESLSANEEVIKKTSYNEMVSSSLKISEADNTKDKNGAESKSGDRSDIWMQNPSLENELRDVIKTRVHSIVAIAANKFICFKQSNNSPLNDDNICACRLDNEQNIKLETCELAIKATDELRNEMKYHKVDNKTVQQTSESKTNRSDVIEELLLDIVKIDILELIADVVHTLRVTTMTLTKMSENSDQGIEFRSLALNNTNSRHSDDNTSQTLSKFIKKIDYTDVSNMLPHSIEEILMEKILEIVKSTKIQMNNIVENIGDSESSQEIKSVTSQEMFNQIIDIIINAASQLQDEELFPESLQQGKQTVDEDVQSQSNLGQRPIEEGIKQSVSQLMSSTSNKYIQEAMLGTSEEDANRSVLNWYPPETIEKAVRLQTIHAVISAAEKLKLSPPGNNTIGVLKPSISAPEKLKLSPSGNNTIAVRHSMIEMILHCVSDMKKLLCILNLITETLNDLKIEAQKNKLKSSKESEMAQERVSETSLDNFKKHHPCMCSCCNSLYPLLHKKDLHNQKEPLDALEGNTNENRNQTNEQTLVLDLKPCSEISDNKFNENKSEEAPVINQRYTAGLIDEILKHHTLEGSSNSLAFHPSSKFGSCKEICSDCQCQNSSLTDEDEFKQMPVISRRYTENLIDEIMYDHMQKRETNLEDEDEFKQMPVISRRYTENLIDEIMYDHMQKRETNLRDEDEFEQEPVISRRYTQELLDGIIQGNIKEVSSVSLPSPSVRGGKPCNDTCSECQCQILSQKKSSSIGQNAFEQIPVISTEEPIEGEIQDHNQKKNFRLTDETDFKQTSTEGLDDIQDHWQKLEPGEHCNKTCLDCQCQISEEKSNITNNGELEQEFIINRNNSEGPMQVSSHVSAYSPSNHSRHSIRKPSTSGICKKLTCPRTRCQKPHRDSSPADDDDLDHTSVINRRYTTELIDMIIQDHMQDTTPNSSFHPNFNPSETNIPFEAGVHCNKTCSECQCQSTLNDASIPASEELEQESVINRRYTKELIEGIIQDHTQDVSSYSSFHPTSKSSENRISIGAGDNALFRHHPSLEETIKNEIIRRLINILNITSHTLRKIPQFADGHLNNLSDKQEIQNRALDFIINVTDELKNEIRNKKNGSKCAVEKVNCNCKEKKFVDRIKWDILGMVTDIVHSLKSKVEKSDENADENKGQSFGSFIQNLGFEDAPSIVLRSSEEIIMEKILDIVKSIRFQFDNLAESMDDSGSLSQRKKSNTSQETFSQIINIIIHIANQFKKELLLEQSTQELHTDMTQAVQEITNLEQEHIVDAIKQRVSHLIVSIANTEDILQIVKSSEDGEQDPPVNVWSPDLRHSMEGVANLAAINGIINAAEKLKSQSFCKSKTICSLMQKTAVNDSDEIKALGVLNHVSDVLNDFKEEESQRDKKKNSQVQENDFKVSTEDSKKHHTYMCTRCKSNYPFYSKKEIQNHGTPLKNCKSNCTARIKNSEDLAMDIEPHTEIFKEDTDESVNQSFAVTCGKSKCSMTERESSQIKEPNFNIIADENETVNSHDLNNHHLYIEEREVTNNQTKEGICVSCSTSSRAECSMFQEPFYHPSQFLNENSDAKMNVKEKLSLHSPSQIPCAKSTCPLFQKISFSQSQPLEGTVHDEVAKDTSDLTMDITPLNEEPMNSEKKCQQSCVRHSIAKPVDAKMEETKSQKESLSRNRSDDSGEKNCKEYSEKLKWYIDQLALLSKQELSKQKTTDSAYTVKETKGCCQEGKEEILSDTKSETISSVTESFLDKLLTISCKCEFPIEKLNNLLHIIAKAVEHTSNDDFQKVFLERVPDQCSRNEEKVIPSTKQSSKTLFLGQNVDNKPAKTIPTDDVKNICDNICEWKMDASTEITSNKKELNVVDVLPLKFSEDQITQTKPSNNENERRTPVCPSFMKEMTQEQLRLQLDVWFRDLKDVHQMFCRQSNFVIKNDFLLANNREKLEFLSLGIAKCGHNLDFIEKSLRECDELHCECLSVHSMYLNTDFKVKGERETMYTNLLRVKQTLVETSKQKDIINEFIKEKLDNSYVTRITRILNCYANTLQGVEHKIQVLENELQAIKYLSTAVLSKRPPL